MSDDGTQPDNKTRRYDRQLRLWAATGQSALESARVLVIGSSATATSILKNLVLPGIGHFTLLDHGAVSPADAGNNFFFDGPTSIGRNRAEEAVRLLAELNDSVDARADTRDVADVLASDPSYFLGFSLIITHNLRPVILSRLADLLWKDPSAPPLIPVRSAGFLAEFYVQFHTTKVLIESHSETSPSLRIDKPFPALLQAAHALDFDAMDTTDHGHIPYVYILVRTLDDWKAAHNGLAPQTYAEKQEFKSILNAQKRTPDEENFEEAVAQAYRAWTPTVVPPHLVGLFGGTTIPSTPFGHLLAALQSFSDRSPHVLPLSATLPDMKSDTENYVRLQNYRTQAAEEREQFRALLRVPVQTELVDLFVKNAHGVQLLSGVCYGALDATPEKLSEFLLTREVATHLALSALDAWRASPPRQIGGPTESELHEHIASLVAGAGLGEKEISDAVGEIVRAPTADLPNVAAFLGGIVAQEAIKMITRQYIPVNGYCVIDLVDTWTGILPS
ncbi:hypothetical protein H4582DRAFT_1814429 [Lactarius indigo]|nr:hypothetical protein H4582DRAFT_1814429 [Lactarius indigo]